MAWQGRITIESDGLSMQRIPGPDGGVVVVPKVARYLFKGEKGAPDSTAVFEVRDGIPECVEIVIRAKPAGRGIRSSDVAMVEVDNLTRGVFDELGMAVDVDPATGAGIGRRGSARHDEKNRWATDAAVMEAITHRGNGPSIAELEQVANTYREHEAGGKPVAAVEALLGYSKRTASRRIAQARDAGLLEARS